MSAFEVATLLDLFDDDRGEVANVLSKASQSVTDDVARIVASLGARDLREIGERAHRIKGTSGAIGARAVHEAAASIEAQARAALWLGIDASIEKLRRAASDLATEVARYSVAGVGRVV
jgi:HPt (histidine-containing phosphotransfer) domain-containing protein